MAYAVIILVNTQESAKAVAQAILGAGLIPLIEEYPDVKV